MDFQVHMDNSDPDQPAYAQPAYAQVDLGPSYCTHKVRYIQVL